MKLCFAVFALCVSGVFGICTMDETKALIDQIRTKLWLVEQLVMKETEMCNERPTQTECPATPVPATTNRTTTTTTTTTEPTTTTTTEPVPDCANGKEFKGHCYHLSTDVVNWESASKACSDEDSHLAVVDDREENDFLRDWAMDENLSVWLDGSDERKEGDWIWVSTGETFTFTDWRVGDPDGARSQNCLVIHKSYDYKWIDSSCKSTTYNYVCERE